VIPALTLLEEARQRGTEILYAGAPGSLEERQARQRSIPFFPLKVTGFAGKNLSEKLRALSVLPRAILRAKQQVRTFSPDLLIGTGGYVQIPWVISAGTSGVPVVLLEPNAVSGWSNRLLAPFAQIISTMNPHSPYGGVPVREIPSDDSDDRFREPLRIVIVGGSQGAKVFNEVMPELLSGIFRTPGVPKFSVVHQSGERWIEFTRSAYLNAPFNVSVSGFLDDLPEYYRMASLVICRAGAMTVTEVTAAGAPAVYIPYPHAIGDHQTRNAEIIAKSSGVWLWRESSLSNPEFSHFLIRTLTDPLLLSETSGNARFNSPAVKADRWLDRLSTMWGNLSNA
jgi:UDP-N-acetylglucosamine--N-acetylmuramyl-(pentapeptide) pyrophosphoryl-undecaprenol N-acetylglucosamine transferase